MGETFGIAKAIILLMMYAAFIGYVFGFSPLNILPPVYKLLTLNIT